MKKTLALALILALALTPASAQECSSSVQSAQQNVQQAFIQGMSGLISNNFSARSASMASMACLDKFMQGNMDILFKPPSLTSLLGTVMNFACQQAKSAVASAAGGSGVNLGSILGSLSGGLNLSGLKSGSNSPFNLTSLLGTQSGGAANGGLGGMYPMNSH